jgi:hypothetical protein
MRTPPTLTKTGRHYLRQDAFDVITDESAYWIGFLFADGSADKKKQWWISARLTASDRGHLAKLRDFLGSTHPITECPAGNFGGYASKPSSRLKVPSVHLARRLLELGRYTGDIPLELTNIPLELTNSRHFWRGVVDGDGSLGVTSKGFPEFQVVGSRRVMDAFLDFLRREAAAARMTVRPSKSIYTVATAGHTATRVIRLLYGDASVGLERKANIARAILEADTTRRERAREIERSRLMRIREWYEAEEPLKQIGNRLSVSDVTIMRWMKGAEIPRRPRTGGIMASGGPGERALTCRTNPARPAGPVNSATASTRSTARTSQIL